MGVLIQVGLVGYFVLVVRYTTSIRLLRNLNSLRGILPFILIFIYISNYKIKPEIVLCMLYGVSQKEIYILYLVVYKKLFVYVIVLNDSRSISITILKYSNWIDLP